MLKGYLISLIFLCAFITTVKCGSGPSIVQSVNPEGHEEVNDSGPSVEEQEVAIESKDEEPETSETNVTNVKPILTKSESLYRSEITDDDDDDESTTSTHTQPSSPKAGKVTKVYSKEYRDDTLSRITEISNIHERLRTLLPSEKDLFKKLSKALISLTARVKHLLKYVQGKKSNP